MSAQARTQEDSLIRLEFCHYRIMEEIGSRAMGVVFRAHDQHLDREVAVNVLHPWTIADEGACERLHKEAPAVRELNHPDVATIYDFDKERGIEILAIEYNHGISLRHKLAAGSLPEKEVPRPEWQSSDGLVAVNAHRGVHRARKSGNLRLTHDGSFETSEWLKKALAPGYSSSRIRDLRNFGALRNKPQFQKILRGELI